MATALPPIHTRNSGTRVSTAHAQHLLSTYLTQTLTDPALQPNALLTESGPSNASGSHTGLIIHNLQRIAAGLRGENLGADLEIGKKKRQEKEGGWQEEDAVMMKDEATGETEGVVPDDGPSVGKVPGGGDGVASEDDWQDRSEFEREQEIVEGEVGDREPNTAPATAAAAGKEGAGGVPKVERGDKAERKRKKAERRTKEKKEREQKRRKERQAEEH